MQITDLIAQLRRIHADRGDIEVTTVDHCDGAVDTVTGVDVTYDIHARKIVAAIR